MLLGRPPLLILSSLNDASYLRRLPSYLRRRPWMTPRICDGGRIRGYMLNGIHWSRWVIALMGSYIGVLWRAWQVSPLHASVASLEKPRMSMNGFLYKSEKFGMGVGAMLTLQKLECLWMSFGRFLWNTFLPSRLILENKKLLFYRSRQIRRCQHSLSAKKSCCLIVRGSFLARKMASRWAK